MDKELLRNGSGYVDPTAYQALLNIGKGESKMEFNRGEIFEYEMQNTSEVKKALIVSADFRSTERYLSVIILTDEPKCEHSIPIVCEGMMYADCGMVSFALSHRLCGFIRAATADEMEQIDKGIARCLGLEPKEAEIVEKIVEVPVEKLIEAPAQPSEELARAKAEADVYKSLYEKLLAKMIG